MVLVAFISRDKIPLLGYQQTRSLGEKEGGEMNGDWGNVEFGDDRYQ
jgi:hypothetical protein